VTIWPITKCKISKAVLVKTNAVYDVNHQRYLVKNLSRFTNYTQLKLVTQYLDKIKPEHTNPSEQANAWFCAFIKQAQHRIDVTSLSINKDAKKALTKVHDNSNHNYIVEQIIKQNKASRLQASFVRQLHTNLNFIQDNKSSIKPLSTDVKNADELEQIQVLKSAAKNTVSTSVLSLFAGFDKDEHAFVYECLSVVPRPLQMRFAKRYLSRCDNSARSKYKANEWFRRTINKLKPRLKILKKIVDDMPLPWHILANVEKTKKHGCVLANEVSAILVDIRNNTDLNNLDVKSDFAKTIVNDIIKSQQNFSMVDYYNVISEFAAQFGVTLLFAEKGEYLTEPDAEIALLKAQCHAWWARKLKPIRARYLEHLEIATGEVGRDVFSAYDKKTKQRVKKRKGINAYCSKQAITEYNYNQERGKKYLESLELVNECGDVISLMKAVDKGMANPKNMRNELMLRVRSTEEMADAMNYVGGFYNITAPSRFHANSPSWDGSTPKECSAYLNKQYQQARAKLDRLEIPYFGIRVAEPHTDGCPHWHMLIWTPERYYYQVSHILRRYFTRDDRDVFFERFKRRKELKAVYTNKRRIWGLNKKRGTYTKEPKKDYYPSSPRFTAIRMEPAKVDKDGKRTGGAAAYIAKYISKNIDGFALSQEHDADSGEKLTQAVNPVKAWASTWGIRQFQFQKSPSITIWRELRRVKDELKGNDELEQVRYAAHNGDFKTFVTLMGGFGIGRASRFKPAYEVTPYGNDYGECVKRLKGIEDTTTLCSLVTRVHTWSKQPIGTADKNNDVVIAGQDADTVGIADLSWTSGNNCTPCTTRHTDELLLDMHGFTSEEIKDVKKDLLDGKKVGINGHVYFIKDGVLTIWDEKAQLKQRKLEDIAEIAKTEALKETLSDDSGVVHCNRHWPLFSVDDANRLRDGESIQLNGKLYYAEAYELYYFEQSQFKHIKHDVWPLFSSEHGWQLNRPFGVKSPDCDGEKVIHDGRIYYVLNAELYSLEVIHRHQVNNDLLISKANWQYAREVGNLAYQYAELDGRTHITSSQFKKGWLKTDILGDIELAKLVVSGEASAISDNDWWAMDIMA
jgi:hypothetical protein